MLHIQAWAFALPSQLKKSMRVAPEAERVTSTDSHAFLYTLNSGDVY